MSCSRPSTLAEPMRCIRQCEARRLLGSNRKHASLCGCDLTSDASSSQLFLTTFSSTSDGGGGGGDTSASKHSSSRCG